MYDTADGSKLNTILGTKAFKQVIIYSDEVEELTGLSIEELILSWIFSTQNNFKKSLEAWKSNGILMDFGEIQRGY